ncbi:hypothetical protein [Roseicyclus mahoneyensis]|uniref:hypothetical protein n=1 Tax=Roseicyclus mahoneyensis TaxID=164332 RepID=UPI0014742334|nr:hypothetical protein [Roseicyclus mahoneyensis]
MAKDPNMIGLQQQLGQDGKAHQGRRDVARMAVAIQHRVKGGTALSGRTDQEM